MQLLIAHSSAKIDHEALVRDIRAVSEDGAHQYLEHIAVGRKSPNRTLHTDLLNLLWTRLEKEVADEGVRYHLEELGESRQDLACTVCVAELILRCRVPPFGRSRGVLRFYR